jgi:hypothetical protein
MINYIGGLKRGYDYARVKGANNEDEYQAAMTIIRDTVPGRSFWITRDAIWKYIEPGDNLDDKTTAADRREFFPIMQKNQFARKMAVTRRQIEEAAGDAACILFALALNQGSRIMLCTAYNLAKIMQMYSIEMRPEAAAQLLMWIQDGLDYLKNMPDAPQEEKVAMGEVTLFQGSRKIGTRDVEVAESDLVMEAQ